MSRKDDELLTPDALAQRWQMNVQTLADWRSQKKHFYKFVRIGGSIRYRLSDIEKYEKR